MSDLLAARTQMGISLAFHIVFALVGIGMPVLMVVAEQRWLATRDEVYHELAQRWAKGTAILFAVGAVSGTVLSFELGLLWPGFMRFAGAIIGMPFSLEGFAFFTAAIFLGIYLYRSVRVSARAQLTAGVPVPVSRPRRGAVAARQVARHLAAKLAAMEAVFQAEARAPLVLGGWPDVAARTTRYAIRIPYGLSLLAFHDPHATVQGLDRVPRDDWPNVAAVHWSFQVMVALGTYMAVVALWAGWVALKAGRREAGSGKRGALAENRWLMRGMALATPMGFIAT